jgi:hypothetical protein
MGWLGDEAPWVGDIYGMVEGSYVSGLEDEINYLRGVIRDEKRDHDQREMKLMAEGIEKNGRIDELEEECRELHVRVCELRDLVADLIRLPAVSAFDCYGCKYEKHSDCSGGCLLIEMAKALGIEAER